MTDITNKTISTHSDNKKQEDAWWHQPVSIVENMISSLWNKSSKQEISEEVMNLHRLKMMDIRIFAKTIEAIDDEKFCNAEFLHFVRLKYFIAKGINGYEGLADSIELLQVAIEAKDSFITIDQTELRYRASSQQELYNYVEEKLTDVKDKDAFHRGVLVKIEEVLPKIKTEEGKEALQKYAGHLEKLSEHQLGLKLLSLFKSYELADYSILQIISQMLQKFRKEDTLDEARILGLVKANYPIFEKLRKIIGLSPIQSNPETYAKILNYIALTHRHALSYYQFDELLKVLRQWMKLYRAINSIRQEHPSKEYKQPKEFSEPIPGIAIYQKYYKSLRDDQTGMTYIDFDEA